jgi:4-amino-4-deoxy-L-arabinose transferase-like glycosyltransferase
MPEIESRRDAVTPPRARLVPWLVFLAGLILLTPSIWRETSVTCSDEYALSLRTPMEMLDRGAWVTPWVDGQPRLRKPPLVYWATLASYHVFGVNLVAARMWGVLAGAGLALCACLFAREFSRSDGALAGGLTLASLGLAIEARQAMLDLPLALFAALAVLFWVRWLRRDRWGDLAASGVALGLAFLAKGPVGWLFFLTGALAALWVFQAWLLLGRRAIPLALWLGLVAAISLPWPLWMKHLWGDRFAQIMGEELMARKFGALHGMAPVSALGGALGLIFPWTPLVLGAIITHLLRPRSERSRETTWLVAWFFLSALPFFFMKAFERYMFAVVPIQAALAAAWLEDPAARGRGLAWRLSLGLLAGLVILVCGFALWFRLGGIAPWIALALLARGLWHGFRSLEPWRPVVSVALALMACLGFIYPQLGISEMPADLQSRIGAHPARVFRVFQPALLSMRLGHSVQRFDPDRQRPSDAAPNPVEVVLVEQSVLPAFEELVRERALQIEELGRFKTFYSRKAWHRFAREDARWPDWQAALRARSLDSLKVEIRYFRVTPSAPL